MSHSPILSSSLSDFTFLKTTPSPTDSLTGYPGVDDHYTMPPNSPSLEHIDNNLSMIEQLRSRNKAPNAPQAEAPAAAQGEENESTCRALVPYKPPFLHWPMLAERPSLDTARRTSDARRKELARAGRATLDPRRTPGEDGLERLQHAKDLAKTVSEDCRLIALAPSTLERQLLQMQPRRRRTLVRALRQLAPRNGRTSPLKIIQDVITFCYREYGIDYFCEFTDGSSAWFRDIDAPYSPGAGEKIAHYWNSSAHYLSVQDVRRLGNLPQYAYTEGDRVLRAMAKTATGTTYN